MLGFHRKALLVLALFATAGSARANGRFPAATGVVLNPSDPNHTLLRTTFGFIETTDGGQSWRWICEGAVGLNPSAANDPPLAVFSDGTTVIGVPYAGLRTSRDSGCSWEPTLELFANRFVVDMTPTPGDPRGTLVLAQRFVYSGNYDTLIAETRDSARTWTAVGTALPSNVIVETLEVAPSDPNRIYVSGQEIGVDSVPRAGVLLHSRDRGTSWQRATIPLPTNTATDGSLYTDAAAYIAAIDPRSADRVYVRFADNRSLPDSPAAVLVTSDRGATFHTLARTAGPMLGFALSPDGTQLSYGGPGPTGAPSDGMYIGDAPSGPFTKVADVQTRCLKWTGSGLYACATELRDSFTWGRYQATARTSKGEPFVPLYERRKTCPLTCPAGTSVQAECPGAWSDVQTLLGAGLCSSAGGTGSGGSAGTGAGGSAGTGTGGSGSCSVSAARDPFVPVLAGFVLLVASLRRRLLRR
ncbi:MAG TPA: hypothetical protein VK524_31685 [Polyangiaceae bacterium]|nr:hypothetical protein [Polyangiaceae bacterium]